MSKLKSSSTGIGTMPGALPNVAHIRPTPPKFPTPRGDGSLADGSTCGNFAQSSLTRPPNNSAGAGGTQSTADLIAEEFQTPATGIP